MACIKQLRFQSVPQNTFFESESAQTGNFPWGLQLIRMTARVFIIALTGLLLNACVFLLVESSGMDVHFATHLFLSIKQSKWKPRSISSGRPGVKGDWPRGGDTQWHLYIFMSDFLPEKFTFTPAQIYVVIFDYDRAYFTSFLSIDNVTLSINNNSAHAVLQKKLGPCKNNVQRPKTACKLGDPN